MRIVKKVKESQDATSFYFLPVDGGAIPDFKPGQYVSVSIDVPKLDHKQIRQYSLSAAPPAKESSVQTNGYINGHAATNGAHTDVHKAYRITVKRESGLNGYSLSAKSPVHPGHVSNLLHDTYNEGDIVEMSHPAGEFFLDQEQDLEDSGPAPIVLISAGVGLTPVMSMLQTLLKRPDASDRKISWITSRRIKPSIRLRVTSQRSRRSTRAFGRLCSIALHWRMSSRVSTLISPGDRIFWHLTRRHRKSSCLWRIRERGTSCVDRTVL